MNDRVLESLSDHSPDKDLSLYDGEVEYKAFFLYNEDEKIKSQNLSCSDFENLIINSIKSKNKIYIQK